MFGGKSLDSVIWRVTKYCIVLYCIDKSHGEMNTVSPRDSHHVSVLDAAEFRRFVRSQDREKFMEVCRAVCGRDVFPRSSGWNRVIIFGFFVSTMVLFLN